MFWFNLQIIRSNIFYSKLFLKIKWFIKEFKFLIISYLLYSQFTLWENSKNIVMYIKQIIKSRLVICSFSFIFLVIKSIFWISSYV